MELDWTYNEERQRETLRHSSGMEARKEKKTGSGRPKTTWRRMVEDEETAGWQSWANVTTIAANRNGWKDNVKALYALWHKEI